ncbi:putative shikimate kinase [Actinoplanes missouriensis 431]|uniref:Shikimate kinase n=1 Tax=Actinoplanes missouriensis (strain ATCC 14538 / DSM 43046 / CBS 188.64 / JCM 3121 / NBRC 102363 / NCIMB 12654 / NRRL B-3342 / UNCC 431) TaxID=512565 RepID=I0HEK9_ACTM4|nr:shikimate kinase [Actinoplanes missouriensis]BAL91446.1 putative shikimate kinase [Actinoplanes missouriensis 431]
MAPAVVLVGVMGAGKTTVGAALAERLGVPFADTDTIIEERAGKPIPEIFVDDGEAAFREQERAVVAECVETFPGVLALGGGAILDDGTRQRLTEQTVVFLTVELGDAIKRVGLGAGRPLLAINPRATLRHLMEQRRPLYLEVATHVIATDGREPADLAAEIAALL